MSLIKTNRKIPVYKENTGFKYTWAYEAWDEHDKAVWHKGDVTFNSDAIDYANDSERTKLLIRRINQLFTQNEVLIAGSGYDTMLRIFKPTEVKMMLSGFRDRENTHMASYSMLAETLGFGDDLFTEFLDIPVMSTKTEYLDKCKVKKYEEYKQAGLTDSEVDELYRRDVAKMTAVYAGGGELITLMAQFAILQAFQFQNKYKDMCSVVDWSQKDEMMHGLGNCRLFRTFIEENPDIWDDELIHDISEALKEMVSYEKALVDYLDPEHLDKQLVKEYIEYRCDISCNLLGIDKIYNVEKNPLPFTDEVAGEMLHDFFTSKSAEYSEEMEGTFEDLR